MSISLTLVEGWNNSFEVGSSACIVIVEQEDSAEEVQVNELEELVLGEVNVANQWVP